ncbi:MAG: stage 0 sporulation family protein, partial [Eubacterium sp.]|nr:stage 0 sporulation family protein [Eubacterium sp.]
MVKVIGIRFRGTGKVYYFDPLDLTLRNGQKVIVETARGPECGDVVLSSREVPEEKVNQPLRPVIRIATDEDIAVERENLEKEKEAYGICRKKIEEHELDMKLIKCEYAFDRKKILFFFTAEGRVDFRELVKDLAAIFRTRIELRQVGVRDETRLLGGIGICGRSLCCSTFLSDFSSVSIRMAKEQNLSLNPTKISGS